jgi:hypothetical protein
MNLVLVHICQSKPDTGAHFELTCISEKMAHSWNHEHTTKSVGLILLALISGSACKNIGIVIQYSPHLSF